MGSKEDVKSPKSEKESPSKQEQTNIHLYPDWATIQTYYGPGVPMQSAVVAGHVPHPHVWAPPQHMMSPYGVPYSTIYSPGIVYAHPALPLVATPVSAQLLSNSTENMDEGTTKKLKRSDGVAMQLVNDNSEVDGEGSAHGASQSVERGIDASSNASDGDIGDERQLKREKRKQANRESARRSRLRKQAETEELMERYENLKVENITLKSEINKLVEDSESLRVENAAMMDKLNGAEAAHPGEMVVYGIGPELAQPNRSEDRFMLNNSSSVNGNKRGQIETHDDSNSEMNLQIFGSKADAVATS